MKILIRYGLDTKLSNEEIDTVVTLSENHGNVLVERWGSRNAAIDIVTFLEISAVSSLFSVLTKPIVEGYLKGLVNEDYFKNLGRNNRNEIIHFVNEMKYFLSAFYEVFVVSKKLQNEAIALVEKIGNVTLYVALNSEKVTRELSINLGEALVKTIGYILLGYLKLDEPYVVQLYPNFETNTWDYVFAPTTEAFGNFVNRYFDFKDNQFHIIESAENFIEKFQISDLDEYKFIISAKYHLNNRPFSSTD